MSNLFLNKKKSKYFFYKSYTKTFGKGLLKFHNCGIISLTFGLVSAKQLETLRRYLSRRINKKSRRLYNLSLTHAIFKKADKSRMGKGSGKFYKWFGYIKPGSVIFEFSDYCHNLVFLRERFNYMQTKMPFKCRLVCSSIHYNA